ncbi:MAG: ABC transporter permease subunit [Clostridia bacterium]|nr:ABC transporter permease subunit [Clostridia bacterium]
MSAVYKRELKGYFISPIGYLVIVFYSAVYLILFRGLLASAMPQISLFYSYAFIPTLFLMPILTMRSFSEERRQKTDQALFTAPVGLTGIVMGKFFAALTVFAFAQIPTLLMTAVFAGFGASIDLLGLFCCLLGSFLVAGALIAIGIFLSCLTDSQVLAAVGGIVVSVLLATLDTLASILNIDLLNTVANWISFTGRFATFTTGVLDYANTVFFLSFIAVFLFLTVRVQEKRRWS